MTNATRKKVRDFAMKETNLSPAEYDIADAHGPVCYCDICKKFLHYIKLKKFLYDWEEYHGRS